MGAVMFPHVNGIKLTIERIQPQKYAFKLISETNDDITFTKSCILTKKNIVECNMVFVEFQRLFENIWS